MNKGAYYVVELLKSLSKKEITGLRALANTTYFNIEKKVVVILDILIKAIRKNDLIAESNLLIMHNTLHKTQLEN